MAGFQSTSSIFKSSIIGRAKIRQASVFLINTLYTAPQYSKYIIAYRIHFEEDLHSIEKWRDWGFKAQHSHQSYANNRFSDGLLLH